MKSRFWHLVLIGVLVLVLFTDCEFHPPTISNLNRTRTVPIHPKRVVVLRPNLLDYALALGITPVGAPKESSSRYVQLEPTQWQSIEETGDYWSPPNLEKILSLKPDLILSDKGQQEVYPLLSQIAPTVVGYGMSFDTDWKKLFYQAADALGKKEKASQVVADYQTRIAQFKARMGTRLSSTKVSVIYLIEQEIWVFNKIFFGGRILEEVGLSRPTSQTVDAQTARRMSSFSTSYKVSLESITDLIDADVMFVVSYDFGRPHSSLDQLRTQPLWLRLKVVQQGRVYNVGSYWVGFGPISANRVLDDLEKYVLQLLDSTDQKRL